MPSGRCAHLNGTMNNATRKTLEKHEQMAPKINQPLGNRMAFVTDTLFLGECLAINDRTIQ